MEYIEVLNIAISKEPTSILDEEELRLILVLLRELPPCRDTVLEYFCILFQKFVDNHFKHIPIKDVPVDNKHARMGKEIECHLMHLLTTDPPQWSFILAKWAIDLLGRLGVEGSMTKSMLVWSNCPPTQTLIHLLNQALHNLSKEQRYACFDKLLSTSIQNVSSFDWAITQISSSFPEEMVQRMLQCGLENFRTNPIFKQPHSKQPHSKQPLYKNNTRSDEGRVNKIVDIVSHLAEHNHQQIYQLLLNFLQSSLKEDSKSDSAYSPLLILYIASQSPSLLKIIFQIFFHFVTPCVLKKVVKMMMKRANRLSERAVKEMILSVLLSCNHQPIKLLSYITDLALADFNSYSLNIRNVSSWSDEENKHIEDVISVFSSNLLNMASSRLERTTSLKNNELSFINSLNTNLSSLALLFTHPFSRKKLLFKLFSVFSCQHPSSASQLLALIFQQAHDLKDMVILRELQRVVSFKQPSILADTLGKLLEMMEVTDVLKRIKMISKLHQLCQHESQPSSSHHSIGDNLNSSLRQYRFRLVKFFYFPSQKSTEVCERVMRGTQPNQVITSNTRESSKTDVSKNTVSISSKLIYEYNLVLLDLLKLLQSKNDHHMLDQAEVLKTSTIFINLFFSSLTHLQGVEKLMLCRRMVDELEFMCHCGPSLSQHIIRTLFIEAIYAKSEGLLGSRKVVSQSSHKTAIKSIVPCFDKSLQHENMNPNDDQNKSFGLLFHSGVIGSGLKDKKDAAVDSGEDDEVLMNEFLFLHVLQTCCHTTTTNATLAQTPLDGLLPKEVVRVLSGCLLEQCMPDGLCSTVSWGDEEFMKLTYARDLIVKKEFESNQLLHKILDILVLSKNGIWLCSCLLRSLLSHLVSYWETCRQGALQQSTNQLQLTKTVITLLTEGKLLPPPLCLIVDLLIYLSPYEIFLLLLEIWKFLKENNPTPNSITVCDVKYTEVMRMIMMDNIQKCGHLFPLFFK